MITEVKYEDHLFLHMSQKLLFFILERLPGFPLRPTPSRSSVMQPHRSLKRSLHTQMWGVKTICVSDEKDPSLCQLWFA